MEYVYLVNNGRDIFVKAGIIRKNKKTTTVDISVIPDVAKIKTDKLINGKLRGINEYYTFYSVPEDEFYKMKTSYNIQITFSKMLGGSRLYSETKKVSQMKWVLEQLGIDYGSGE